MSSNELRLFQAIARKSEVDQRYRSFFFRFIISMDGFLATPFLLRFTFLVRLRRRVLPFLLILPLF